MMCDKRNFIPVWIPHLKTCRYIDECISDLIENLNEVGIKTLASCCGHGKYPATILIKATHLNFPIEIKSGILIPRKRNFYRKDDEGFYYIPESRKNKKR